VVDHGSRGVLSVEGAMVGDLGSLLVAFWNVSGHVRRGGRRSGGRIPLVFLQAGGSEVA
jgi:hypothetical protein